MRTALAQRCASKSARNVISNAIGSSERLLARPAASRTMATRLRALTDAQVDSLVEDAVVWSAQNGLVVGLAGVPDAPDVSLVHAPFALLPCKYPRKTFEQAKSVMTLFNDLTDRVANDEEYLKTTLEQTGKFDPFTGKLLELLNKTEEARHKRRSREIVVGVHRSDYMLDAATQQLLQVELNTVASSFGCLSTLMARLHKYVISRMEDSDLDASQLPANEAMANISDALAAGAKAHGGNGMVVMVVQPGEKNAYDQQWLNMNLWDRHGIRTVRKTLKDLATEGTVTAEGDLMMGGKLVSLVYFRAGYTPDDYFGEEEWYGREVVERSTCAKSPTVAYQLAGSKKVQQDLAVPGQLERFCSAEEAAELKQFFTGLWSLDEPIPESTQQVLSDAMADPDSYVMKPQREGGGNNLYGPELAEKLKTGDGLAAYILMQRIKPAPQQAVLVRKGKWSHSDVLSELGVYGTYVKQGEKVLLNKEAGHLVRTKIASSNEGGVAAGFAVLDSPYMV